MHPRPLLGWSITISVLTVLSSVVGLVPGSGVYARETENWTLQARGQDAGNLLAVVVLLTAATLYRRGSRRAGQVWLGTLLYLVYAFTVYAMAVHLNGLFLVYVGVLGLSAWALLLRTGELRQGGGVTRRGPPRTVAAWVLITTGVLFAGLWLGEIVPALVADEVPRSLAEAGLPVNPIHALDLSMVLPAFIITGTAALRGRRHGLFWLAPWLVFSTLMGSSIVAAMVLLRAHGAVDTGPATVVVTAVTLASLVALGACLRPYRAGELPPLPTDRQGPMLHA
jgi:hypothetical protein